MSLSDWERNGWLKAQTADAGHIANLLAIAERDLKDCRAKGLSDDWKFNIAYNAALQASSAALAVSGYAVPKGESNHFRVIQSLAYTIGLEAKSITAFDRHRKKRSVSVYDAAGVITKAEAESMIKFANDLVSKVRSWLDQVHPELLDDPPPDPANE